MKLRLQADLQLEYEGHHYQLRSRPEGQEELELVIPNLAAAAAAARFGIQWGPGLATQLEPIQPALKRLPPIRVLLGQRTLAVLSPGRGVGFNLVLKALQRLGQNR